MVIFVTIIGLLCAVLLVILIIALLKVSSFGDLEDEIQQQAEEGLRRRDDDSPT